MMPFFSFDDDEFFGDLLLMGAAGGGKAVEATATGNPLTFQTDLARPLKSLLIPFTPVQSGSGDPSPQNIRPIVPWDGLKVWGGGGNLMPHPTKGSGVSPTTGASTTDATRASTDFIPAPLTGNKSYTFSGICDKMNSFVASYNASKQFLGRTFSSSRTEITVTKDSFTYGTAQGTGEIAYLRFAQAEGSSGHSIDEIDDYDYMMNVGSSAMPYEEYKPITETDISFSSPVYGGTLDVVSGVLTVEWAEIASYNGETLPGEWLSDRDVYSAGTTPTIGAQVVYKLATPQEITLTPEQITAIVGDNTIWSDADGSMTAVYLKKG